METRPKRKDSFLGMHFDFHAGREQAGIGAQLDEDTLEQLISRVKPDYVQCDTKGHAGNSSYPTQVGYPAPDMQGDILRLWRRVTARHGVALYAHHSGVWDNRALEHHPEWAAVNRDGVPDRQKTSVFGPYARQLLVPQLKELALTYGLDGAWVDGECWAVMMDYSRYALEAWKEKTGKAQVEPGDEAAYLEFNRQGFRDYVAGYINAVHEAAPDFEIASNWMYTSYTPEKRTVPVDFISGDYAPSDSMSVSRVEARCAMGQDRPWDLMAWGFTIEGEIHVTKELRQLCQEAASVISLGGGFQVYNPQLVDSVQRWAIPMWEELAAFCRARQALCHGAAPVPQAAVVFSEANYYADPQRIFPFSGAAYQEVASHTCYLLDCQISTEIKKTHQLEDSLGAYGLLVLPDCEKLEPALLERLIQYVKEGGSLLVSGPHAVRHFAALTGVKVGEVKEDSPVYLPVGRRLAGLRTDWAPLYSEGRTPVMVGYEKNDDRGPVSSVAYSFELGEGRLVLSSVALKDSYHRQKSAGIRDYVGLLAQSAGFVPSFTVEGSHLVEAALMKKDGDLRLNLTNMAGVHEDHRYRGIDEIPAVGPLAISIAVPEPPRSVMLMPEGRPLAYSYENGIISCSLDRLLIHSVIQIS